MTSSSADLIVGGIAILISALGFGSMFVPIKRYELKDGLFVQWVECSAIMFCGIVVYVARGFPTFYPVASLGGVIWALGNLLTVPVINVVGAGLGLLIWGSAQIVVGWATARFGFFGLPAEVPNNNTIEYVGVALTLLSAVGFGLVKPAEQMHRRSNEADGDLSEVTTDNAPTSTAKKTIALGMAVVAGLLFGGMLTPVTYVETRYTDAPQNGLDYVFAYCVGVHFTSTISFVIYAALKRNKPYMPKELLLPSLAYGVLWSIALFSWLVSSQKLSQAISFPISTRLPGIVASLWGVFYFKEVTGTRNLLLLAGAIVVAVVGVVCVGLADVI